MALCVEFEGTIHRDKKSVVIAVMCTNRSLVERFRDLVQCGYVLPKNGEGYEVGKTSFTKKGLFFWKVKGTFDSPKNGLGYKFYREIEPYLITKKLKGEDIANLL